jgi:hypothetical protein
MRDGESIPLKYPRNAINAVQSSVLPLHVPPDATVELIIALDASGVKARDLASYLSLIDHVYGRLDPRGLMSYAHRKTGHLELSHVRRASVELVISELMENAPTLVVLFLVLKYLPEALRNLASAYKDYEEARLIRFRRSQLRDRVMQDKELASISENHKRQLVESLDRTYGLERDNLPGALRLAHESVRGIALHVCSADAEHQHQSPDEEDDLPRQ